MAVSLLMACSAGKGVAAPGQALELPAGHRYGILVWYPDGRLLAFAASDAGLLYYASPGDLNAVPMALAEDPRCQRATRYGIPTALPDGRLGLVEWCAGRWPDRLPGYSNERYLVAYDWATGRLEPIVDGPLLNSALAGTFTWNPAMTRGVQELSGLLGTLYWLTPAGAEPMRVTVGRGGRAWSLDENFAALADPARRDVGIAGLPAWSPDGAAIAFFASVQAVGRSGVSRGDAAYGLYLMDPVGLQPTGRLDGVYDPTLLAWAPDSRWLAFIGRAGVGRRKGLWLFDTVGEELTLLVEGEIVGAAWSPTGQAVAVTRCLDADCVATEVWLYDVSGVVTEAP